MGNWLRCIAGFAGFRLTQIVALDLPNEEEMSFSTYETGIVAPVRQFLEDHQLRTKVKCLLTFYGVPFRIRAKVNSFEEQHELAEMQRVQGSLIDQLKQTTLKLESEAGASDPAFVPGVGDSVQALIARANAATLAIGTKLPDIPDEAARNEKLKEWLLGVETIGGKAEIDARMGAAERGNPKKTDAQRQYWTDLHQLILDAAQGGAASGDALGQRGAGGVADGVDREFWDRGDLARAGCGNQLPVDGGDGIGDGQ